MWGKGVIDVADVEVTPVAIEVPTVAAEVTPVAPPEPAGFIGLVQEARLESCALLATRLGLIVACPPEALTAALDAARAEGSASGGGAK